MLLWMDVETPESMDAQKVADIINQNTELHVKKIATREKLEEVSESK